MGTSTVLLTQSCFHRRSLVPLVVSSILTDMAFLGPTVQEKGFSKNLSNRPKINVRKKKKKKIQIKISSHLIFQPVEKFHHCRAIFELRSQRNNSQF